MIVYRYKGLAPKTVRNIHQMICSAYNLAMEQKLVNKNPTQGCALPKVEHKEMKTLTADQLSTFFREAKETGVDVKTVSSMLGHYSAGFTLDTYVHVLLGKHADTGNVVRNQTAHAGDSAVLTSMYSAMRRS